MDAFASNFNTIDWLIVSVYLAGSIWIGVLANRYIHSTKAYLVGGARASISLNAATYIGTTLGLVTLMYASIEAFSNGFAYVTLAIIGLLTNLILGATGLVIAPLREMNLLTIPEFFERRYSRRLRIGAGSICALAGVLNMGLFPKMGATFITYATGLHQTVDDPSTLVSLITSGLLVLVLGYTILGGMVSVIITDYIQFIVLSIGMSLGVYFCLTHTELGWTAMLDAMESHRGARMFTPLAEQGYGWTWILFNVVVFFVAGFCWAPEASRALTARDATTAKRTFLVTSLGMFVRLAIPALWAIAAFTLVSNNTQLSNYFFPDGLAAEPAHAEQAMPAAIGAIVPAGLLGILVAGLLAAFMSTHDSYLLCWSSVLTRDVIGPLRSKPLSDRQEIGWTRANILVIGLFLLVWGVWYELPQSVWDYMAVSGAIYLSGAGPALIGGLYWRRASTAGAWAALLCGLFAIAGLFLKPIQQVVDRTGIQVELTQPMFGLANFALCTVMFVLVSLLAPDGPSANSATDPGEDA